MDRLIATNSVSAGAADAAPATGTPQFATNGNPATATPATVLPAYAFNAIQEELIAIITGAGIATDKTNNAQVVKAIRALIKQSTILTDTGAANAYTAVNPTPFIAGTLVHGVRQTIQFVHANTGASTYAPDGLAVKPIYGLGLTATQGGEIPANGVGNMIYIVDAALNGGNGAWILTECTGGAQQVLAATKSNQAVNLGQFTSSKTANGWNELPNGTIEQWGAASSSGSVEVDVTLPITFPTAGLEIVVSCSDTLSAVFATGKIINSSTIRISAWLYTGARSVTTVNYRVIGS